MLKNIKNKIKQTPLSILYIFCKSIFVKPSSQGDEALILQDLVRRYAPPKLFIEFGFSGWEYNCACFGGDWTGLLIDTDPYNVKIAKTILPKTISARRQWLNLDNMHTIADYVAGRPLGVLSIDVDGNDYWFLRCLLPLNPAIIVVEYNSSFGYRSITVPYDVNFDRMEKHQTGLYYGASLKALANLAEAHDFSLVAVNGINAFFVKTSLLRRNDSVLDPEVSFKEKKFLDGASHSQQWEKIKHLEFVTVD